MFLRLIFFLKIVLHTISLINGKTLLVAQAVENTDKVHNVPIKPGHQKFLISSAYIQRAELWKDFDVDKHCRGAYVVWDLRETNKVEKNFAVTPASNPISFSKVQETD